jgi:hypothetical protein
MLPSFPLRLGGVLDHAFLKGPGLRGADRAGCHEQAVPRRLPQFETSGISQPFWPWARQRNSMPIHHRDLRGLRDSWSRGCEKSDDRIVGCRLTNSSRPPSLRCAACLRLWSEVGGLVFGKDTQGTRRQDNGRRCEMRVSGLPARGISDALSDDRRVAGIFCD